MAARRPAEHANRLQERRTLYGTNTGRQRPRYKLPGEYEWLIALDIAVTDTPRRTKPALQPPTHSLGDVVGLLVNGQVHAVTVKSCFRLFGRERCEVSFQHLPVHTSTQMTMDYDPQAQLLIMRRPTSMFGQLSEIKVKCQEVSLCTAITLYAPQGTALMVI